MSENGRIHTRRTARRAGPEAAPAPASRRGMPLDPATRSRLEPGFGHSLSDIRVHSDADADRLAQGFSADAFTVGQDIFFSQGRYDPGSAAGGHLLAHEVAHAVQQRGADARGADFGTLPVPGRHARSETEAHAAAHAVTHGRPARVGTGAGPAVSRWEAGEHKHAVDDAKLPEGMGGKITLANGMEVTPGQVTAMMGDMYGKYDKAGHFDPAASFEQMNHADPKEMKRLIALTDKEAADPTKISSASDFEFATRNRGEGDSYLELAKKNSNHFSAPTADGTDNNMGAYTAFHQMALDAAKSGKPEDMERARALEASGDHFLTDRFPAGHNLDKKAVEKASGYDKDGPLPNDTLANLAVKMAHDDMNDRGATLHDGQGSQWFALGDGHWADDRNADNRAHTKKAVADSWAELAQAGKGGPDAASVVPGEVPQFDPKNEKRAETTAALADPLLLTMANLPRLPDAVEATAWRMEGQAENAIHAAGSSISREAKKLWDALP